MLCVYEQVNCFTCVITKRPERCPPKADDEARLRTLSLLRILGAKDLVTRDFVLRGWRFLLANARMPRGSAAGMNGATYVVTAEPSPLPEKTPDAARECPVGLPRGGAGGRFCYTINYKVVDIRASRLTGTLRREEKTLFDKDEVSSCEKYPYGVSDWLWLYS